MLTIMEVDEEKVPPTKKLAAVWPISPHCVTHILDQLKAHEDTASQWTEDAHAVFTNREHSCGATSMHRAEAVVLITNSG